MKQTVNRKLKDCELVRPGMSRAFLHARPSDPAVARVRVNLCVRLGARRTRRRSKMKFGAYLEENMEPEWKEWYLRYKPLKIQLKEIVLNEELAMKSADPGPGIDGRVSFTPRT